MAPNNLRIITGPDPRVMEMICRRLPVDLRKELSGKSFAAIALVNANVPSIYYFADVAQKASAVVAAELSGTCPQHVTTLALFGDISAIRTAVSAIEAAE